MQIQIRNFSIIAHIDSGKSTLADRLLELTGSVEPRLMRPQVLDTMELERERGITIKLQPAKMVWRGYTLNLIDTPGHVDFSYEVSRSLAAVEGALLLVDATQGVQAQTLANLHLAVEQGLKIIPVINKIDLPVADVDKTSRELEGLRIDFACDSIPISAKTGQNVKKVLEAIVQFIPPPSGNSEGPLRALIFDSYFDSHRGVITYIRLVDGELKKGEEILLMQTGKKCQALEVGTLCLGLHPQEQLQAGEIGYVVMSLKEITGAKVGDTITKIDRKQLTVDRGKVKPLPGYKEPKPLVFAALYVVGEDFQKLREALAKLKLNDDSLFYEPTTSRAFGFGFRAGFLGLLHLEIVKERLEREYDLDLIVTLPTVAYKKTTDGWEEPWVKIELIVPQKFLGPVMQLITDRRGKLGDFQELGERVMLQAEMPLAEVIVDFYDKLKAVTQGFGSLNYEMMSYRPADLVALDVLVADEKVDALSRMVLKEKAPQVAGDLVEQLKELIPRQNFEVRIQAAIGGKIIASERIPPYRKDVTAKLYGGDVTRKRKLLEKQKKGKRKMAALGRVQVPTEIFIKLLKQ